MKRVITILAFIPLAIYLSSCCTSDKQCPAGDPTSYPVFPYALGESLTFKDSAGQTLSVTFGSSYTTSPSTSHDGVCHGSSRKVIECHSDVQITGIVSDPSNLLTTLEKQFIVGQSRSEESGSKPVTLAVNAFGMVNFILFNYGTEQPTMNSQAIMLSSYQTPYKSYSNVWTNPPSQTGGSRFNQKLVWTAKGRLISFALHNDTTHLFHIVE